jgi:hypothetical protein
MGPFIAFTLALVQPPQVADQPARVRVEAPRDPAREPGAPFAVEDDLSTRARKAQTAGARGERRLVVDKSRYLVEARIGERVLQRYVVNLGFAPTGRKERQGDGRTPEGRYYIRDRHGSRFTRFWGLSYPATRDVERGRLAGLIDARTAERLREDERRGRLPDWKTRLGGAVGIHGGGAFLDEGGTVITVNWTWGCIGLRDQDLLALEPFVSDGTPVDIVP